MEGTNVIPAPPNSAAFMMEACGHLTLKDIASAVYFEMSEKQLDDADALAQSFGRAVPHNSYNGVIATALLNLLIPLVTDAMGKPISASV